MAVRANKASRDLNISLKTVAEFLERTPGLEPLKSINPNAKLTDVQYDALKNQFAKDKELKQQANELKIRRKEKSIENTAINDAKEISKPISEEANKKTPLIRLVTVPLSLVKYENHYLVYRQNSTSYVCFDMGISKNLESQKNFSPIKEMKVEIILDPSKRTLRFKDQQILEKLKALSIEIDEKVRQEKEKNKEEKKINKAELEDNKKVLKTTVRFSKIRYGEGFARIKYKKHFYKFNNPQIKGFNKIINSYYKTISDKVKDNYGTMPIKISINKEKHSFEFIDFNLHEFMQNIKDSFMSASKKEDYVIKTKDSQTKNIKTKPLTLDNIEFFDGYYRVVMINKGKKDYSITPLKIVDNNSFSFLHHVHRYFSDRFPKDIIIEYTDERVEGINRPYILCNYIRTLNENIDVHGDWWEEVQNERKPSLSHCRSTSIEVIKKKVSLKNGYLDNLASMQNDKKLIPVYEINHGIQEDAFIFTVGMQDNRCAIIFENVSAEASTATEVFIAKNNDYESCVNLVFDYFTDYTISTKRDSLRKGVNPPNKFKAEKFFSVIHGELETWLIKMNRILERTPQTSKIEFIPGLHIPSNVESRSGNSESTPKNIHNELIRKLYSQLCKKYGENNVGTEIKIGTKRIDTVVKRDNSFDVYEVKSDPNPFTCITIALGQICQYAYLYCRDKIGRMVIVGSTSASKEVEDYLAWFRNRHSMEVYYMSIG